MVGLVDRSTIVGLKMDDGEKKRVGEKTPLAQIVGLPDFEVSVFPAQSVERKREGWTGAWTRRRGKAEDQAG